MAGWLSYTYSAEGATFKYPPDWTLSTTTVSPGSAPGATNTTTFVVLTSADKKFQVQFGVWSPSGLGGACPSGCYYIHAQQISVPNLNPLWLAGESTNGTGVVTAVGLTDSSIPTGDSQNPQPTLAFKGKEASTVQVIFDGCLVGNTSPPYDPNLKCAETPTQQFYAAPDEQTAELILKSLSY